jgi:hypothetical protein
MSYNSQYFKDYYQANKEALKQKAKENYLAEKEKDIESLREKSRIRQYNWRHNPTSKYAESSLKYKLTNQEKYIFQRAKIRAKRKGLEFNIDIEDIIIPEKCPLLEIPINMAASNQDERPSLDRIDSTKGYVKGNIMIISWKANKLKNNFTSQELLLVGKNLQDIESRKWQ